MRLQYIPLFPAPKAFISKESYNFAAENKKKHHNSGHISFTSSRREPRFESETGLQDAYGGDFGEGAKARHQDKRV